jgi:hypothetical protein
MLRVGVAFDAVCIGVLTIWGLLALARAATAGG